MNIDLIDDTDDGGIDGRRLATQRFAGGSSLEDDQHFLVHTRPDTVHRQQRRSTRLIIDAERLHEHQLRTLKLHMFLCRHDRPDNPGDLHAAQPRSQ